MVSLLKGIKQQGGVAVSFWFYDTPVVFVCVWLVPDDSHTNGEFYFHVSYGDLFKATCEPVEVLIR